MTQIEAEVPNLHGAGAADSTRFRFVVVGPAFLASRLEDARGPEFQYLSLVEFLGAVARLMLQEVNSTSPRAR